MKKLNRVELLSELNNIKFIGINFLMMQLSL